MGRDDLYVTVPSFFRCPISLDVMKSPVSLCTGVTYERSSIQRWLDSGNNTCPATMQTLQSRDLVPNHTLQRLIQIWSDSVATRPHAAVSPPLNSLTQEQAAQLIRQMEVDLRKDDLGDNFSDALSKIISFAQNSEENRKFLVTWSSSCGRDLASILIRILGKQLKIGPIIAKAIQLYRILLDECSKRGEKPPKIGDSAADIRPTIMQALQQGSLQLRKDAVKLLEIILATDSDAKNFISEQTQIFSELLRLVTNPDCDAETTEASLSCLLHLSKPKKNRLKLVRAKAVEKLGKALAGNETENNQSRIVTIEKLLKLLEIISTCKEGRMEMCESEVCVGAIVKKVLKVSDEATEAAVTILWSLCCLFRDQKAQEAVAKNNGMAKILLLLQSNCGGAVRQMGSDLLKVFRINSKYSSCLVSSYDTKTTHIMPF